MALHDNNSRLTAALLALGMALMAPQLQAELATAPAQPTSIPHEYRLDGTVEAMSLPSARAFTLSVQWHPEHARALAWPLSRAMFQAFGDAARARAQARLARAAA